MAPETDRRPADSQSHRTPRKQFSSLIVANTDELKRQLNIVDVVGSYVSLKRRGSRYVGLCPFHSEKTPSFGVHAERQFFKCFGCDAKGDVIGFVQQIENLTFPETLKFLAERYGLPIDPTSKQPTKPRLSEQTLSRAWLLIVGLRWRLDRSLETAKLELWGPHHEDAAHATKTLTEWRARIDSWTEMRLNGPAKDPRSFYEAVWRGRRQQEEAVELLRKLSRKVVRECIAEATNAHTLLARAVSGQQAERAA